MQKAIASIKARKRSIRITRKYFSILPRSIQIARKFFSTPPSSISNWLYGKIVTKWVGHNTYLTKKELAVRDWCFKMQDIAFYMSLSIFKNTIKDIVWASPQPHPFKDDLTTEHWWKGFKNHHPNVVLHCGDSLKVKMTIGLNKNICSWFFDVLGFVITFHRYKAISI